MTQILDETIVRLENRGNKMRTEEEILQSIEKHIERIIMHSRILQAYKTPGLSLKEINELEKQIRLEYEY